MLTNSTLYVRGMLCLTLTVGLAGAAGCGLTSVDAPDVVEAADYESAAGASALALGARAKFSAAFGGGSSKGNQIGVTGVGADELLSTALNLVLADVDRRSITDISDGGTQLYLPLQVARASLVTAITTLQRVAPDSSARIGEMYALVGYTEVFLGETYCAGVPLSYLDADFRPVYGTPLTTDEMLAQAVAHLDSAQEFGADSIDIVRLAAVGKGRALLDRGDFTGASAAVAAVPTAFTYDVLFRAGVIANDFADNSSSANWYTVPEQEGTNGINWRTANDPRVPLDDRSPIPGQDGVTPLWVFRPYRDPNAPIALASGKEARLIEAEAALQGSDISTWLASLNTLRAAVPGLDPLVDPGAEAERVDLHFRERAFWMFLTGHRFGDLRRLVRQYGREADAVFPTGSWRDGLTYGTATTVDPGSLASNNPNYTGCLNHDS